MEQTEGAGELERRSCLLLAAFLVLEACVYLYVFEILKIEEGIENVVVADIDG